MKAYSSLKMFTGFLALVLTLVLGRVLLQAYALKNHTDFLSGLLDGKPLVTSNFSQNREIDDAATPAAPSAAKHEESFLVKRRSEQAVEAARNEVKDFKKIYQKPEKCYDVSSDAVRIWCANHFMQARKAFEQKKTGS